MRYNQTQESTPYFNRAGGKAYKLDPYTELYSMVCTCLVNEPNYYTEVGELESRILDLINTIGSKDPIFIMQLAYYARTQMHMRTISHVLLGEASLLNKGEAKPHIKEWTPHIIQRVDDINEVIAYVKSRIGEIGDKADTGSLPQALKEGLQIAFTKFNAYQFGKYRQKDRDITLQDVIRIVHPTALNEEQNNLFKSIRTDTLPVPETWETYISKNGSNTESWSYIAPKLPIFALLRNLRNLLEHKVDMNLVLDKFTNANIIHNSKIFPYRFYSAYKVVSAIDDCDPIQQKQTINALNTAIGISCDNLEFGGRTAIFVDDSGSMDDNISTKSTIHKNEIAYVLGTVCNKINNTNITLLFGDNVKKFTFDDNTGILTNVNKIDEFARRYESSIGHSTYAFKCVQYLLEHNINVDRIVLFSDMQCYGETPHSYSYTNNFTLQNQLEEYRKTINKNVYMYEFNLSSYGDSPINIANKHTLLVSGFSEKIFSYIPRFEEDGKTVVQQIKQISIPIHTQKIIKEDIDEV